MQTHNIFTTHHSPLTATTTPPPTAMLREKNKVKREKIISRANYLVLDWIKRRLPAAQERIRHRAAICLLDFMVNHRVSTEEPYKTKVITAIRRYKRNILRCQRFGKSCLHPPPPTSPPSNLSRCSTHAHTHTLTPLTHATCITQCVRSSRAQRRGSPSWAVFGPRSRSLK